MNLFLLDVRPDPLSVAGIGGLILLAVIVLIFTAGLVTGFVFLLKRLRRRTSPTVKGGLSRTSVCRPTSAEQAKPAVSIQDFPAQK